MPDNSKTLESIKAELAQIRQQQQAIDEQIAAIRQRQRQIKGEMGEN